MSTKKANQGEPQQTPQLDENELSKVELEQMLTAANSIPIAKVSPQEIRKEWHNNAEVNSLITQFGDQMGLDKNTAFIAIALLFLKGAANKGTPNTMSIMVHTSETQTEVTKADLVYLYKKIHKNMHIRRLAESMAELISKYAEAQGLAGDLAKKINITLLRKKEPTLTRKEAAWCSSFCQSNPKVEGVSERLAGLLSEDYLSRFQPQPSKRGSKAQASKGAKSPKEAGVDNQPKKK